jgi:uncharacterized membrane protein YbhN (UPF0104 family)
MAKRSLRIILLLLFAGLVVWFFATHKSDFSTLTEIPPYILLLIALCQVGVIVTNIIFQFVLLKIYAVHMPWKDNFKVIVKSSVINFFGFLQGGAGYRAYYLKKNHAVEYRKFGLLFAANYIVVFLISAFFGLVGALSQLAKDQHLTNVGVILFFGATTIFLIALMFINPTKIPATNRLLRKIRDVLSGWELIIKDKRRVFQLFVIGLAQYWILTTAFFLELKAIHVDASLAGLMIYSAIAGFSLLVALTPAAIGFRETLLIFARQSLGVSISAIILAATVDRVVYFFLLLGLSVIIQDFVLKLFAKKPS